MGKTISDQTHTVICIDSLTFHPNKFKHLGAEIEAGEKLAGKDWHYYEGNIKAIIVDYAPRDDMSKASPAVEAAIDELRADALAFVKTVAKCEVHPADWDISLRSTEVLKRRFWLIPAATWHAGTLMGIGRKGRA